MKHNILIAIRLTLTCDLLFGVLYTSVILGIAHLSSNHGKGVIIIKNGKTYYSNLGQSFTDDKYFNSRPSAVDYNAAGSGGSNKGPSNPSYLEAVQARIDTLLAHNPGISRNQIPAEMVCASGSGLDPDISFSGAILQVKRIAKVRQLTEEALRKLIVSQTEQPLAGLFGVKKINVLKLNLALDELKE